MEDPKNNKKIIFFEKVSKWTNSSKNRIKSEIWGPSKNFPFGEVTQVNDRTFLASFCG